MLAGCTSARSGSMDSASGPAAECATAEARLSFDFEGASPARCVIEGPRAFALVIAPEHAPPINPSPWYAFRYEAEPGEPVRVRLDYLGAEHRYVPKLLQGEVLSFPSVAIAQDRRSAAIELPPGTGTVSAQPLLGAAYYDAFLRRLVAASGGERIELGRSLDGAPIMGARFGRADAPHLVTILGRQHPPELTGSHALEPFLETLVQRLAQDPALAAKVQILAVPLLNPDGVARGHWRANRGGVDLNRDWGPFSQPETRAVRDWLARAVPGTQPLAMLDFHSTGRNLFYVQGDEANAAGKAFLAQWLGGKEQAVEGYPFEIAPRNANPGSGTSKNWFFECFAIPAYTYEVGDDTDPAATARAARKLAADLVPALMTLAAAPQDAASAQTPGCLRG